MLTLYNTRTKSVEPFAPIHDAHVTLYTCGPTVYASPHIGNWMSFLYWDVLVRALRASGYSVERTMNITDVGHLVSDADEGEDKLEKGARREGKTAWEIAAWYTKDFLDGMSDLGMITPEYVVKATDMIEQQLSLVRTLKAKGYTYQTTDGIYFDTSKFPNYAEFAHLDLKAQKAGARVEENTEKRQPWDFALWKFTPIGEKRDMEWETPDDLLDLPKWDPLVMDTKGSEARGIKFSDASQASGNDAKTETLKKATSSETSVGQSLETSATQVSRDVGTLAETWREAVSKDLTDGQASDDDSERIMGFPGWHLECSAIALTTLGDTIDIHTGGIDHIPVHHTNEIAQSEAATGKRFANYWLHNNHLKSEGKKISKSLGNGYTLSELAGRGYSPMDLRMFALQSHYRSEGNFTWENLESAKQRLNRWRDYAVLRHQIHDRLHDDTEKQPADEDEPSFEAYCHAITSALLADLNTPAVLKEIDAAFATLDHRSLASIHRHGLVTFFETIDELTGLDLMTSTPDIDDDAKRIMIERHRARENKDWQRSDELRDELAKQGIAVRDSSKQTIWSYLR